MASEPSRTAPVPPAEGGSLFRSVPAVAGRRQALNSRLRTGTDKGNPTV